jgi:hypothetical protein
MASTCLRSTLYSFLRTAPVKFVQASSCSLRRSLTHIPTLSRPKEKRDFSPPLSPIAQSISDALSPQSCDTAEDYSAAPRCQLAPSSRSSHSCKALPDTSSSSITGMNALGVFTHLDSDVTVQCSFDVSSSFGSLAMPSPSTMVRTYIVSFSIITRAESACAKLERNAATISS